MVLIRMAAAVMSAAVVAAATAASGVTASPSAWKGLEVVFVSKMEPPGTELPGGVFVRADVVLHSIRDNLHKRAFCYDVGLDPSADANSAQIRIERCPEDSRASAGAGWTFLELPKYPVISGIKVGDTVALDLLVNPATGQKIADYITLRRRGDMDLMHQARDFQVADADLRLFDPQVVMDGKPQWSLEGGGVGGPVVWLAVDGRGRFILSLLPNEKLGFRRGGVVSRDGLLIRVAGEEIRVNCSREIAPGEGAFNLYVLHEPDWRPRDSAAGHMGSADKPEYIIGKK
jgi:hypothetical protein